VYWGYHPDPNDSWTYQALPAMAQAWRNRQAAGARPPRIGMFYDTSQTGMRDLRTPEGAAAFYFNMWEFFTFIPRDQWAMVAGRPVIYLFTSDTTGGMDQSTFDFVYQQFEHDFGVRPYIVREISWDYPILGWSNGERILDTTNAIRTENSYQWASAIYGFFGTGGVANIGPGFDDRLVGGTTVTDRVDGNWYQWNWYQAIMSGQRLVMIESWNEAHEGSGISETLEFGRQYIDLTRMWADYFHSLP
jgi:hypothetical protein